MVATPVITKLTPAIPPAIGSISNAFAVPTACEVEPRPRPIINGFLILNTLTMIGMIMAPKTAARTTTATVIAEFHLSD